MQKNQDTIKILQKVSDDVLQAPIELEVDIIPQNFVHRLLQRWKMLPAKRDIVIRPITLGNLIRISKLLLSIDISVFDVKNLLESNYKAIAQHAETAARVIAIAVQGNREEPSPSLVRFVLNNFTAAEMKMTLGYVLRQMDVTSFMTSIISMRGLSVLESHHANAKNAAPSEVSPTIQEETIAPGTPSAV